MTRYQKLNSSHEYLTSAVDESFSSYPDNNYNDYNDGKNNSNNNDDNFNFRQQQEFNMRSKKSSNNSGTIINDATVVATTCHADVVATTCHADEDTFEVPLLNGNRRSSQMSNNNNNNYNIDYEHEQYTRISCRCNQPGFGANLTNKSTQDARFKILLAIGLCCVFMIVEFFGGLLAGSLAIMADAAHLASDCISFIIGLVAIWLGGKPPDHKMSFGYKRMEVMGAVISILGIWLLTATLVIVAVQRIYSNDFELEVNTMMVISAIGILINIVMIFILHGNSFTGGHGHSHSHGHSHNHSDAFTQLNSETDEASLNGYIENGSLENGFKQLQTPSISHEKNVNLRAALIHVIGDLVQSVGVFLASVLIKFCPNAKFADPLCTLLFSVIVIMTTVRLFRESMDVLLDAVPKGFALKNLEMDLLLIEGVKSIHHLNVWNHTANYRVLMVHLTTDFLADNNSVLQKATNLASSSKYNIKHCTIQIERLPP